MKRISSILLLFIMTANVAVSLVEQLRDGTLYEINEGSTDDGDEKEKGEKGKDGKEKKLDTIIGHSNPGTSASVAETLKGVSNLKSDFLTSEYHGLLPELPPKA